jgi:hypothetical protein
MHGVPKDLDLRPWLGATLLQLAIGQHEIQLRFDRAPPVCIEGEWELQDADGVTIDRSLIPNQLPAERDCYRIHRRLGCRVVDARVETPKCVVLVFEGPLALRIVDDSEYCESFHIGDVHV